MKTFFILGNHPNLSLAEIAEVLGLNSLFNSEELAVFDIDEKKHETEALQNRLGGVIKIGEVVKETSPETLVNDIALLVQTHCAAGGQKVFFGISGYCTRFDVKKTGISVKNVLKHSLVRSRFVISKESKLSSVIVKTNKLLTRRGCEIVVFSADDALWLGITKTVQPFDEYSSRDYGRPNRDPKSGMLPPKLARIMINLSAVHEKSLILDPFCGMGTILQEALHMGFKNIIGSDVDHRVVDLAEKNIEWIQKSGVVANSPSENALKSEFSDSVDIFESDARAISKKIAAQSIDAIITEPYLGPPLNGRESILRLRQITDELSSLYSASLREFGKIIKKNGRLVMIFPIIQNKPFEILPVFIKTGYVQARSLNLFYDNKSRASFVYGRPGQLVRREIFVLVKK